jgi:hypothetical protein
MGFDYSAVRHFGLILGARYRSPKPESWVQLLVGLPIQYTSRGLPASPLGFEPKARRFDSCLVFQLLLQPVRSPVFIESTTAGVR